MENLSDNVRRYALIVAIHLAVVLIWYLFVVIWEVPEFVMPTPADTVLSLWEDYNWLHNTMITAGEVFGGYLLAVAVGVGLALLFSWSPNVDRVFMPLIVSLNMIPKVALGPLFIVWFSYGLGPNIIITFSICFLPVLITTARGLREVEPDLIDLVRSLRLL